MKYGTSQPVNICIENQDPTEVWVWGRVVLVSEAEDYSEPLGLYLTQAEAEAQCGGSDEFVAPIPLNQPWPDLSNWSRAYFPLRQL